MEIDTLVIKLMSLAVHAEEFIETGNLFDAGVIRGILTDPEIVERRMALEKLALLPVKR